MVHDGAWCTHLSAIIICCPHLSPKKKVIDSSMMWQKNGKSSQQKASIAGSQWDPIMGGVPVGSHLDQINLPQKLHYKTTFSFVIRHVRAGTCTCTGTKNKYIKLKCCARVSYVRIRSVLSSYILYFPHQCTSSNYVLLDKTSN